MFVTELFINESSLRTTQVRQLRLPPLSGKTVLCNVHLSALPRNQMFMHGHHHSELTLLRIPWRLDV